MGKRSNFKRRPQDAYYSPPEVVDPLLPHLPREPFTFWEPCAGAGDLSIAIVSKALSQHYSTDISPGVDWVAQVDAFKMPEEDVSGYDLCITNPPWSRPILHPMIEHFSNMFPTWLLFDADWIHTKQSIPYLPRLRKIVSVGRVSWMQNGTSGKDNCAWYLFDTPEDGRVIEFVGRADK